MRKNTRLYPKSRRQQAVLQFLRCGAKLVAANYYQVGLGRCDQRDQVRAMIARDYDVLSCERTLNQTLQHLRIAVAKQEFHMFLESKFRDESGEQRPGLIALHRLVTRRLVEPDEPPHFQKRQDATAHELVNVSHAAPVMMRYFSFVQPLAARRI
jgi:hypothetical protein